MMFAPRDVVGTPPPGMSVVDVADIPPDAPGNTTEKGRFCPLAAMTKEDAAPGAP
jgi:hypothetical protein